MLVLNSYLLVLSLISVEVLESIYRSKKVKYTFFGIVILGNPGLRLSRDSLVYRGIIDY